ncbi:MAG: hypothetical protein HY220_00685 [Candidatus Sungbacteria bacterium]|uniref:Uncharacterized protein n=1 Tax=Candidatus Sungiibacteriota bacterium TaxID=2750080 RepID=A0A9D6LMV4_9BACT|nr:hypothetical protein [Candidatus Sungbacteria bacterium]
MQILLENFGIVYTVAANSWWFILPAFFLYLAAEAHKYSLIAEKIKETKWLLLEIKVPREILKSPEAMERVFAGLHGPYDPPEKFKEYYLEPKIRLWYNFEIAGQAGDIRFYAYVPVKWRNLVEAQMYAQYPDISIAEAKDYTASVPDDIPNADYDMWGMELTLARDMYYPILTYKEFKSLAEPNATKDNIGEALKIDPLSAFAESLAKLHPGEQIWFQLLARPCGKPGQGPNDNWAEKGQELVDKLAGREKPKPKPWYASLVEIIAAFFEEGGELIKEGIKPLSSSGERGLGRLMALPVKEEKKVDLSELIHKTQGEKDVMSAVEEKISKLGYETVARVIYVARRDVFDMATVGSLFGMVKQFNTNHLNAFKPNGDTITKKKDYFWGFVTSETHQNRIKQGLIYSYKKRSLFWDLKPIVPFLPKSPLPALQAALYHFIPNAMEYSRSKPFVLNTEEMATLFHFPGSTVSSPSMPRIQAKASEPPINLPTG